MGYYLLADPKESLQMLYWNPEAPRWNRSISPHKLKKKRATWLGILILISAIVWAKDRPLAFSIRYTYTIYHIPVGRNGELGNLEKRELRWITLGSDSLGGWRSNQNANEKQSGRRKTSVIASTADWVNGEKEVKRTEQIGVWMGEKREQKKHQQNFKYW